MRNALVLTGLLAAAILCFSTAGWLVGQASMAGSDESAILGPSSDIPPGVRFIMVALGGFRGLLADALWVRASRLQDEGNVFEVAQLTEWITQLEPRSPEVWSYHAWNLAYNIASLFPDPADRWRWVNNGIRLLRDRGIRSNPRDSRLYWELGWLYADKAAGRWDSAQLYYRASLAGEMSELMGGERFRVEAVESNAMMAARFAAVGLRPEIMALADETYGPLDWRLPESHALYWGLRGRPFQTPESRWCDRLIWNAMTGMVDGGALYFDSASQLYLRGPRLDLAIKGVRRCEGEGVFSAPLTVLAGEQFLREAMVWLYAFGRKDEADEAVAVLRRLPDSQLGTQPLDVVVRQELALRLKGVDRQAGMNLVEGLLVRGYLWKALKSPDIGAGLELLARLHWEALVSLLGPGETGMGDQGWREISQRALETARRELPNPGRSPAGGN
jgi:hypothetical protein